MNKTKSFLQSTKAKVVATGAALLTASLLTAADAPVIPTEPLKADYAMFDYVFAGIIGVCFIFMVAGRVKRFIF